MSLRNIRFCSCRQLRSIIGREHFITSQRQHSSYRSLVRNDRAVRSRKHFCVTGSINSIQVFDTKLRNMSSGTVSTEELKKFKVLAPEWWKTNGEYVALHSLNKLRVALIREVLDRNDMTSYCPAGPLSNMKILDVGCGGGILAEPLARLGAQVVGIDPLPENIEAAKSHTKDNKEFEKLSYECTTVEDICNTKAEHFDLVVASEVVEHVECSHMFIQDCCKVIKPGGKLVVTTINRTVLSTLLVKYAAEYLLRVVPQDTHDENKFVKPDELVDMLRGSGMVGINFRGMFMNPLTYRWFWTDTSAMNYACYATKPM